MNGFIVVVPFKKGFGADGVPLPSITTYQTCFCQTFRLSCFGELPDVVLPKNAQNAKTNSKKVKIWLFF